jgi:hypothetical protein
VGFPARPAGHRGRWRPRRVGAVRRGGMVAACATASLIYACRDRRSVFGQVGAFGISAGATTSQATPIEASSRYSS